MIPILNQDSDPYVDKSNNDNSDKQNYDYMILPLKNNAMMMIQSSSTSTSSSTSFDNNNSSKLHNNKLNGENLSDNDLVLANDFFHLSQSNSVKNDASDSDSLVHKSQIMNNSNHFYETMQQKYNELLLNGIFFNFKSIFLHFF
jgi:hypothetical protein